MKLPNNLTWPELRHRFVLTPEEKRVIIFVIVAFFLGAATECYRVPNRTPIQRKGAISHGRAHAASAKRD